jgi:hypothetical protein
MNKESLRRKRKGMRTLYQNLLVEIEIMKRLNHPALIHLFEVIDDPNCKKIYLGFLVIISHYVVIKL